MSETQTRWQLSAKERLQIREATRQTTFKQQLRLEKAYFGADR
ncbi:MAG: hypothetical protein QXE06_08210 [Candidatus Bathyarchaeia archaeon]